MGLCSPVLLLDRTDGRTSLEGRPPISRLAASASGAAAWIVPAAGACLITAAAVRAARARAGLEARYRTLVRAKRLGWALFWSSFVLHAAMHPELAASRS